MNTNSGSDIRVIRTLSDRVHHLTHECNETQQKLWEARAEVQRLERLAVARQKELNQTTAALVQYEPKWQDKLTTDHWDNY